MLTLPPSVKIYVAAQPVDARKSFDGLAGLVESEFGLEPLSGHQFLFLNRRGHVAQILFWDRNGFCIVRVPHRSAFHKRGVHPRLAPSASDSPACDAALQIRSIFMPCAWHHPPPMAATRKPFVDELTPIAEYMTKEMNANAAGPDCARMATLNAVSTESCIEEYRRAPWWQRAVGLTPQQCIDMELSSGAAALMIWTSKVMQDADWDHKPKIRKAFLSQTMNSRVWHAYGGTAYFYDVWSNVHYGYVGIAAGFSESTLLDGAGLEQIGSDLLRSRWPKGTDGVKGLRRFDGVSDRVGIMLGMDLFRLSPRLVAAHQLRWAVLTARRLTTKGADGP